MSRLVKTFLAVLIVSSSILQLAPRALADSVEEGT